MQIETYEITYTDEVLQIGCEQHPIPEWWNFDDNRIGLMDSGALEFWRKWKPVIRLIVEVSPAATAKKGI